MKIAIRESFDADVESIALIYAHSVATETASWEYEAPSTEEFARRRLEVIAKGFPYLVAVNAGRVIGYAYGSSYRARIGYRFAVEDSVYVHRDFQGQGIGKQLLESLIKACERRGFRQMIAVIGDSENVGSITLHERCGFQKVGTFKSIGFKFGRWLDSIQMARSLGAGNSILPPD